MTKVEKEYRAKRELRELLEKAIVKVADIADLDEDRLSRRVLAAKRNEVGSIFGMLNLLVNIALFPAEQGDGASVPEKQKEIFKKFNLDLCMLDDFKKSRGYHTFSPDGLDIYEGIEPDSDELYIISQLILKDLLLSQKVASKKVSTYTNLIEKVDINQWQKRETVARTKVEKEVSENEKALAQAKASILS